MMEPNIIELEPGVEVERDVFNIAQKIKEYDQNLVIQFLDPDRAEIQDAPYRLVERGKNGEEYVVFYIWELDDRVLERIYAADSQKFNVSEVLDKKNEKARQNQKQRYKESLIEAHDIALHFGRSVKNTYTFTDDEGKKHTLKDGEY